MAFRRPTIIIDFDGTIHSYDKGWHDGSIYGTVIPGFFEWCERMQTEFSLVVVTSRASNPNDAEYIQEWLGEEWCKWCVERKLVQPCPLYVSAIKPPALVSIDDRSITFRGDWNVPELQSEGIRAFKPWNQ